MYAIILIKNHQYKISENDVIKTNILNIKINDIFIINKILLIKDKNYIYFNDNYNLKNIFILCRLIGIYKYKKNVIFKMKRRKNVRRLKYYKTQYSKVFIEKIFCNLI